MSPLKRWGGAGIDTVETGTTLKSYQGNFFPEGALLFPQFRPQGPSLAQPFSPLFLVQLQKFFVFFFKDVSIYLRQKACRHMQEWEGSAEEEKLKQTPCFTGLLNLTTHEIRQDLSQNLEPLCLTY